MPYMLALAGQQSPWLLCMCGMLGKGRHVGEIAAKLSVRPLFLLFDFFLFRRNSSYQFWEKVLWHLWIVAVEVFNVGRCLTHGDMVLQAQVDFVAVAEHRLIPARVRSEWARLRSKGLATRTPLMLVMLVLGLLARGVPLFLCLPLPLLSLSAFLTMVELSGARCHLVLVGLCIWWLCMDIKVLILMLSSLL